MRILIPLLIALLMAGIGAPRVHAADADTRQELIVWGAWERKGLDAAFRRFELEHPGWKVVVSTAAGAGQMDPQKLICGIAGGDPPDTLIQDRLSIAEWAVRDTFFPLDDLIAKSISQERLASGARDKIRSGDRASAVGLLRELITSLEPLGDSKQLQLAKQLQSAAPGGATSERADELVALCQGIRPETFYQTCWEEACFGEDEKRRVYGIPNTTDVRALYYNEDFLARAGLVDAEGKARPPKDWDELREYAYKLTQTDDRGNIVRLGFAPLFSQGWLYTYGWLNGGEFMSPDGRRCTLADPKIAEALAYIVSIYDGLGGVERVTSFQSTFQTNELDAFLTGKLAMKIDSDFAQNIIAQHAPNLRYGIVPLPAPKGRKSLTWSGGFSWVIPSGAKNPEMAFEFIRFLMTDRTWKMRAVVESRVAASRGRFYIPELAPLPHVNQQLYEGFVRDSADLPERLKKSFAQFTAMMGISRFRPVTPVGQLLWDEHARAPERALRHRGTPAQVLAAGQAVVQEQLDIIYSEKPGVKINWLYPTLIFMAILGVTVLLARYLRRELHLHQTRVHKSEMFWGYFFAAPWLIGLVVFTAGPIAVSLVYSFCRYDVLHPAEWIGMENYRRLLFDDPLFWKSLANTAFMILGVPLGMAAGLGIAMLLHQQLGGMRAYRTVFYLPAIVPVVASSLLWLWVLNPQMGLLNSLIRMFGVDDPPRWLASPSWLLGSKTAIIIMGLWSAGSSMIMWLAGLNGIPKHLYESAEIDGAGPWRRFLSVTLPMLTPYLFFNLVTGIIGTMQIFSQAYIMTRGGPDDSTMFYAYYLFNSAFRYFKMGYASAMAWILFLIVLVLTLIQLALGRRWVHYDTV